jgi:hypothetical protein
MERLSNYKPVINRSTLDELWDNNNTNDVLEPEPDILESEVEAAIYKLKR